MRPETYNQGVVVKGHRMCRVAALLAVIMVFALIGVEAVFRGTPPPNVTANNNTIVNIGGGRVTVEPTHLSVTDTLGKEAGAR